MKLKTSLLALAVSLSCAAVWAQDSKPAAAADERPPEVYTRPGVEPLKIFYKWRAGGKTHYGKYVPRGVTSYTKINEQGMLVTDRPTSDSITVLRPVRPTDASGNAAPANDNQPLPPGSIPREQRCVDAQRNLQTIATKTNIVEDDGKGNLIALSSEQIAARKQEAEDTIARYCQQSTEPVVSPVKGAPPKGTPTTVFERSSTSSAVAPVNIPPAVPPAQPILPATAVPPPQPQQQAPSTPGTEGMSVKEQAGG
jgi:hypothetical protein